MASRNVSNNFTVAGRSVQFSKETLSRQCVLNDCIVSYVLLRNKLIPGKF